MKRIIGLVTSILSDTVVELFGGVIPVIGDVADVVQKLKQLFS